MPSVENSVAHHDERSMRDLGLAADRSQADHWLAVQGDARSVQAFHGACAENHIVGRHKHRDVRRELPQGIVPRLRPELQSTPMLRSCFGAVADRAVAQRALVHRHVAAKSSEVQRSCQTDWTAAHNRGVLDRALRREGARHAPHCAKRSARWEQT
jgi:hypothetical protein